ncbi:hypothetical protein AA0119_g12179 [Alternaria tenuissima]|uniref:Uncharacterized protein n=1 Tax=Alternaria tenuissima TaxID=119927 RepID=A0ABY0FVM5_9PLEO|nr:hypothetical protein B0T12DRAFT_477708 [Alternaria alternata]RYN88052.1 hypothetical protein AA0119_g12179 [Alternaria tenuissima]RYO07011.1 hypothetical protein AA0121_g11874 [Alternaria tenuissima]
MDANEQRMRDAALHLQNQKKTSLRPAVNNADDSHTENSEFDYTGIIPNITADAMGQAPDVIGSDLNMLLSINGFKTTMFVDTDKPVDVGKELASKMVSKADPVPRDAAGNASLLATAPLSCGPDADGSIVTGQCVYYKVPLAGSAIENSAWHAHVRLETSMPLKALEVLQERKTRLSLPLKPRRTASGIQSPVNATTVSAIYNTSDDMGDFISAAVKTIDPKFKPVDIIELGRKWVYQFYTDPSIGPAAVMDAFQAALSAEMQTMPSSKVVGNPIIKIESQTTVLA